MTAHPFDLIHANVSGLFAAPSHAGYTYLLTILNDCTRYTWIYMLKHKYDVLVIIPQFFQLIQTQNGKNIKVFQYDKAFE